MSDQQMRSRSVFCDFVLIQSMICVQYRVDVSRCHSVRQEWLYFCVLSVNLIVAEGMA